VPLEEMAALFGDQDQVVIFSEDIHVDHITHELVVNTHNGAAADGGVVQKEKTGLRELEKV
jgi:hypothetical protein